MTTVAAETRLGSWRLVTQFDQQVESAIQDDFKVKVYGETAVVWFTLNVVGIKQEQEGQS